MNKTFFSQKDLKKVVHLDTREKTITYQVITIAVSQNAKRAGVCSLQIGSKKHDVEFTDKSSLSETLQVLYESLSRQLDRYYYVTIDDNNIVIASIFASPSEQFFFVCGSTGILAEVTVEEKNRSVVIPVLKAQEPNQIIVIDDDYDFGGEVFKVPANATLQFHGGCIKNARLKYDNTLISGDYDIVNCICEGKLANPVVRPEMFGARTLNFRDNSYDISGAIQTAYNSGNYDIEIDNSPGNTYSWYNPVKLYEETSADPRWSDGYSPDAHSWNVSIRGTVEAPVVGQGSHHTTFTIIIHSQVAFKCYESPSSSYPFDFHKTPWPCIYMSNLSFAFYKTLNNTVFLEGVISRSRINGINVCNCWRFIHGGITVTSLITNCFVEICEYAFGGYMVDSKVQNCYFTAYRKSSSIEPVFYMNSILYGNSYQIGSLTATSISNNFINFFYTVFMMGHTWDDCILTHGNIFNVFKFFALCKYWVNQVLVDRSDTVGTVIISNGDTFRNCNNFPISHPKSTDRHLSSQMNVSVNVRNTYTESGVTKYEIYSILGKIMNNSAFQINSFIDETNSFVFARDKARKVGTTDEFNESDYSFDTSSLFTFRGDLLEHSGEFICGGRPSMYPFKFLSSSTSQGLRLRRPTLHDLQDMMVTSLPTTQLFNGRRVVYNNEICTYRQSSSQSYTGTWVNPNGVVRGTVS